MPSGDLWWEKIHRVFVGLVNLKKCPAESWNEQQHHNDEYCGRK